MSELGLAIESIYSFIARTAEETEEGYRWQTIDYSDKPQYHFNVFNGVGGIPLFLRDYYRLSGEARAIELASGAVRWCLKSQSEEGVYRGGLQSGKAGIAFMALHLSEAGESIPAVCEIHAQALLDQAPGPVTDLMNGEASHGWFFLKLWERSENPSHLAGAIRCAEWISSHLVRDRMGTHCLTVQGRESKDMPYTGLLHGISGMAHFFALLAKASGEEKWRSVAIELLETLITHAIPIHGGLNWSPKLGETTLSRCQHSHGAAGIGLVFAHASVLLNDSRWLEIARQAGEATYAYGDFRHNPTLCTGLAGSGELLIELFRLTRDTIWWQRARDFAQQASAYKQVIDGLDYWPTDTAGLYSADYSYGASGTGLFFIRTLRPLEFEMPLI
jgi:lantibiotic modifying enzyme